MEQLPNERQPVRLRLLEEHEGRPQITLGPEGREVDILPSLERLLLDVSGHGVWATVTLKVGIDHRDLDMVVDRVVLAEDPARAELSAEEIDRALASKGFSESAGECIVAYLKNRGQ